MTTPHAAPARPRGSIWPLGCSMIVGGRLAVTVHLYGKHGRGRMMTLDETDWARVRLVLGERWHVGRAGASEYVVAYGGKAAKLMPGNQPLVLARWLTWAEPGEVVCYRDGNPLNLCRGNLESVSRLKLPERMRGRRGIKPSYSEAEASPR